MSQAGRATLPVFAGRGKHRGAGATKGTGAHAFERSCRAVGGAGFTARTGANSAAAKMWALAINDDFMIPRDLPAPRIAQTAILHRCARVLVALTAAVASAVVLAWPDQPITVIVPYTPGTGVDVLARLFASRLSTALGQPVVVENVPGASSTIGTEKAAHAKPDGYTFLAQTQGLATSPSLYKGLTFDPQVDLVPVSLTGWSSFVLVVPASSPVRTLPELVAAAAATPGKLTYATPGVGTQHHVATVLLMHKAGITMLHVPYKGTAGATADILGGRIDTMLLTVSVALPHIRSGKLVALATSSPRRLPQLPAVPTFAEARLDVGNLDIWHGLLAPTGTPAAIVDRMNREIAAIAQAPGFAAALDAHGIVPATSSPAEFGRLLTREYVHWAGVIDRAGIKGE